MINQDAFHKLFGMVTANASTSAIDMYSTNLGPEYRNMNAPN